MVRGKREGRRQVSVCRDGRQAGPGVMYPSGMAEGPAKFNQGQRGVVDRL